jgi:hypothetical protein
MDLDRLDHGEDLIKTIEKAIESSLGGLLERWGRPEEAA